MFSGINILYVVIRCGLQSLFSNLIIFMIGFQELSIGHLYDEQVNINLLQKWLFKIKKIIKKRKIKNFFFN